MVDKSGRNGVKVGNRVRNVAWHQAGSVHQHQGTLGTQPAEVGVGRSTAAVRHRGALVRECFRQIVDEGRHVRRALEFHFLLADSRDRTGAVEAGLRNARTRDDHGFDVTAALRLRRSRDNDPDGCGGSCSEEQGGTQIAGILIDLEHVEPPWFCR